jgi:hypothetical protein
MSKLTHKLLLTIAPAVLLLAGSVFNIYAQDKPAGSQQTPRATPTPTPLPTPTPQPPSRRGSRISDRVRNSAGAVISSNSVRGTIRWRKEYGLVPSGPVSKTPSFWPCDPFFVAAMTNAGRGGTFGRLELVAATHGQPSHGQPNEVVGEEGNYYVCRYIITELPTNKNLVITAGLGGWLLLPELDPMLIYHTAPWIGGSQPQPPQGYDRVFIGGRSVRLTDNDSRAVVDFEVVYRPVPAPPR